MADVPDQIVLADLCYYLQKTSILVPPEFLYFPATILASPAIDLSIPSSVPVHLMSTPGCFLLNPLLTS